MIYSKEQITTGKRIWFWGTRSREWLETYVVPKETLLEAQQYIEYHDGTCCVIAEKKPKD